MHRQWEIYAVATYGLSVCLSNLCIKHKQPTVDSLKWNRCVYGIPVKWGRGIGKWAWKSGQYTQIGVCVTQTVHDVDKFASNTNRCSMQNLSTPCPPHVGQRFWD